ncbi:hypothetical protein [Pseudomonas aeruginosa]|uniref:hypothetical protein n=1 Tax=Pseudomonas aeruginosa TaxID=287 RepID=UPI00397B6A9E
MTKANECTCPSGDGSLRHPCPAHPAVEQAGGDERAAFRPAQVISYRPGMGEVTIYVAGRVPGYMNIGDTVYVSDRAPVEQPSAALAQPSPTLPPFAEKVLAKLRRFYDCAEDFESGGVDIGRHWLDLLTQLGLLNRVQRSPALWEISQQGEDLLGTPHPSPAQAEQAEAERPEVVGQLVTWPTGQRYVGRVRERKGCKTEDVMTVAQHERIVGELRADRDSWAEQAEQRLADWDEMRKERDAALVAQAQHSVPAYVSYTTRPAESLAGIALRQLKDESRWVEIRDINAHAFPDMQSHSYYPAGTVIKLPAAAPGKSVPQAWLDVLAERRRQVEAEGWTPEHDDLYCAAELPRAAAAYILSGANDEAPAIWPFLAKWWKPRDARANYMRAGALILAEIERLDRAGVLGKEGV